MKKEMMILAFGIIGLVIAMAVGLIGVAIGGGFDQGIRDPTTGAVNGITVATNGSVTFFGTTYPYITAISGCVNATDAADTLTDYTVYTGNYNNDGNSGFILQDAGADFVGETINCSSVTYKAATTASNQIPLFIAGITTVASFIALISLIMVGAVMISMVKQYMKFKD